MRRYFGAQRPANSLDRRDWDGFIRDRRAGTVRPAGVDEARTVRSRTVQKDLRLLLAVLNWGTVVRKADGKRLLPENPFAGFALPHEENPRRPILTHDEFERLLATAPTVNPAMATLLVLANETGHRIGSIRLLRCTDIDLQGNTIRWRGEHDQIGPHPAGPGREARLGSASQPTPHQRR